MSSTVRTVSRKSTLKTTSILPTPLSHLKSCILPPHLTLTKNLFTTIKEMRSSVVRKLRTNYKNRPVSWASKARLKLNLNSMKFGNFFSTKTSSMTVYWSTTKTWSITWMKKSRSIWAPTRNFSNTKKSCKFWQINSRWKMRNIGNSSRKSTISTSRWVSPERNSR